jgi:hypothetical protein
VRKLLLFLVFLFPLVAWASSSPQWLQGSLVLGTREVLTGEVAVEARHNVVLFRQSGHVDVYPAHKISAVYYYDPTANVNRKFISIPSASGHFPVFHLYEVVLAGPVDLLRQERQAATAGSVNHEAHGFEYVVRFHDHFIALRKFRSRIYPRLMRDKPEHIAQFVKANGLNPNEPAAAIQIIQYYNRLVNGRDVVAMRD